MVIQSDQNSQGSRLVCMLDMDFAEMVKVIRQLDALAGAGRIEKSTILKEGDNVPSAAYRRGVAELSDEMKKLLTHAEKNAIP